MPRIQINLRDEELAKLEEMSEQLHAGDTSKSSSEMRSGTVSYLIRAVAKAHETIVSNGKQIDSLRKQLENMAKAHTSERDELNEMVAGYDEDVKAARARVHYLTEALASTRKVLHYLTEGEQ